MDPALDIAWTFLFGIGFGLAATMPPGPINTEMARRTLKHGWLPGLAFGLGSIFVENGLAVASSMGYGVQLSAHPRLQLVLLFVGFMVLSIVGTVSIANGYRAWNDPAHAPGFEVITPEGKIENVAHLRASPGLPRTQITTAPRSFFAGAAMAIISPYTIIFWIVGLPAVAHRYLEDPGQVWMLLLGILVGTSAWIWGFTAMLAWLKRYSSTWWIIWADLIGGVMLLVFAALALLRLAQTLLRAGGATTLPF